MNEKHLDIGVEAQCVHGTLITPDRSGAAIPGGLFIHGWGGSQEQYLARAREIAALGCVCLTFDLRGHARSDGRRESVSRADNLRDALAAYDTLVGRSGVDKSAVFVVGSSYGGYLGAILTSLRPVRRLSLRAPALYKDDDWNLPKSQLNEHQDLATYRRRTVRAEDNRALQACAAFRGDVLLVESEHDHIVPHPEVANYLAACIQARSLTHRLIGEADHALSEEPWRQAYTKLLVSWLEEMTTGPRARETSAPNDASGGDDEIEPGG